VSSFRAHLRAGQAVAAPPDVAIARDLGLPARLAPAELGAADRAIGVHGARRTDEADEEDQRRVLVELTPHGDAVLRELSLSHRDELQTTGPALVQALNALLAHNESQTETSSEAQEG